MNKTLIIVLLTCLFFNLNLYAQEPEPVVKSSLIENLNGIPYYIHVVKKGQTIFSIAKAYEIAVEVIYESNPESVNGIQPENILKIPKSPLKKSQKQEIKELPKPQLPKEDGFIFHVVKEKETLFGIAKQYSTTIEIIFEYNKDAEKGIFPGNILKIPLTEINTFKKEKPLKDSLPKEIKTEKKSESAAKDTFLIHEVQVGETMYSLTKLFQTNTQKLIQWNPELSEGLKAGQKIKIWIGDGMSKILSPEVISKEIKNDKKISVLPQKKDVYNVALIMPLYLYDVDDIQFSESDRKSSKDFKPFNYIQFYEGLLIALDSLKKEGLHAKLWVYDSASDSIRLTQITKKPEFEKMDLIIGPFFSRNAGIITSFAQNKGIRVVLPFIQKDENTFTGDKCFFVTPSIKSTQYSLAKFFVDSFPESNVLIIHNNRVEDNMQAKHLKNGIANYSQNNPLNTLSVVDIIYNEKGFSGLRDALVAGKNNVVVVDLKNEAQLSSLVNLLNKIRENYKIQLVASSDWKKFSSLDIDYLVNLNFHMYTASFVDYRNQDVKNFVFAFREKYKTEPSMLAFQGYDIASYFLNAMLKYGVNFEYNWQGYYSTTMQSDFEFISTSDAYENVFINVLKYDNYSLFDRRRIPR